jgi:fatty acid desaturase
MALQQLVPWSLMVGGTSACLFVAPFLLTSCRFSPLVPVLFALSGYSQFAVVHEAIHGSLHPRPGANRALGRACSVLFGSPFAFLRDAHLLHHKYNRKLGHPDLFEPATTGSAAARAYYLFDLFFGLYLKEFAVTLLCLLPRRWWSNAEAAANGDLNARLLAGIARDSMIGQVRRDALAILVVYGASALLYSHHLGYFVAMLLGRALVVSLHDNAYHYRTDPALLLYARNLRAPRLLSLLLLHFNYHGIHHLAPGLPWFRLPAEFARRKANLTGDVIAATFAQLGGPFPLDAERAFDTEQVEPDVPSLANEWQREA